MNFMKKQVSKKTRGRNLKKEIKKSKEEKQENSVQKKPEIKKQEKKQDFFNDSESFFSKTSNTYGEEALEHVIPKKRFRPIITSSVQELEDAFEEVAPVNLEKSLKNIPTSKDTSDLSPSYATTKNIEYGTSKYDSKSRSSYETPRGVGSMPHIATGPGDSAWKDMSNVNIEPGVNQAIGRNKDYEPISKKRREVW